MDHAVLRPMLPVLNAINAGSRKRYQITGMQFDRARNKDCCRYITDIKKELLHLNFNTAGKWNRRSNLLYMNIPSGEASGIVLVVG